MLGTALRPQPSAFASTQSGDSHKTRRDKQKEKRERDVNERRTGLGKQF